MRAAQVLQAGIRARRVGEEWHAAAEGDQSGEGESQLQVRT